MAVTFRAMRITRQQALDLYGGSAMKLAAALEYTSRHAIYMWPKEGPIPETPYLKLRYELKPEAFNLDGSIKRKFLAAA